MCTHSKVVPQVLQMSIVERRTNARATGEWMMLELAQEGIIATCKERDRWAPDSKWARKARNEQRAFLLCQASLGLRRGGRGDGDGGAGDSGMTLRLGTRPRRLVCEFLCHAGSLSTLLMPGLMDALELSNHSEIEIEKNLGDDRLTTYTDSRR